MFVVNDNHDRAGARCRRCPLSVTGHRRRLLEKLCGGLTDSWVIVEQCLAKHPGGDGTTDFTERMHGIPAQSWIVIALHDR